MYADINFKTKRALKEAVAAGKKVGTFQPGGMFPARRPEEGATMRVCLEGPHYPAPHAWYAEVLIDHTGRIIKVK